jgi:hypothetical protein
MPVMLPRQVIDLHADLTHSFTESNPQLKASMIEYARKDVETEPGWAYSHMHPAESFEDRQMLKWYASLAIDLFGATTYQVTADMVRLAEHMTTMRSNRGPGELSLRELPAPWGFMWLDKSIPAPAVDDNGQEPLEFSAVSWAQVPGLNIGDPATGKIDVVTGVRLRKWGYNDSVGVWPRPLHLMGQHTIPLDLNISYHAMVPDVEVIKMIWVLMGMEITSVAPSDQITRAYQKRIKDKIRHHDVNVVKLRRTKTIEHDEPAGPGRNIPWRYCWLVRGHWRRAPNNGTFADGREKVWIKPYIKGPGGMPLKVNDIIYKLQR